MPLMANLDITLFKCPVVNGIPSRVLLLVVRTYLCESSLPMIQVTLMPLGLVPTGTDDFMTSDAAMSLALSSGPSPPRSSLIHTARACAKYSILYFS